MQASSSILHGPAVTTHIEPPKEIGGGGGDGAAAEAPPLSVATNGFRAPLRTREGSESGESTEIPTGKVLTPDSEGAKSPRAAAAALVLALD